MARKDYVTTEEWVRAEHPAITDRRELPKMRREWMGRRVAIRYINARGNSYRRTSMGWKFGVLVTADRDDQIAVREKDGHKANVHYRRVTDVYDLTRRLCATQRRNEFGHSLGTCRESLGHEGDHRDHHGNTWTGREVIIYDGPESLLRGEDFDHVRSPVVGGRDSHTTAQHIWERGDVRVRMTLVGRGPRERATWTAEVWQPGRGVAAVEFTGDNDERQAVEALRERITR